MNPALSRLFNPKSIALFGGAWAENVILQLQKSGFEGDIWPVHPTRKEMAGVQCFQSVADLPSAPDASFVGVNRKLTVEIIEQLSTMGGGGATCFASGFQESEDTNGKDLQAQLVKAAGDMPILGPNCYGFINYLDNVTLWPDQHGGRPIASGVAIIGQSSNVLINMTMQTRSLPIAHVVAAGNQAQTGLSDIADTLLDDERVTALGLYIEGFGDIRKLEALAAKARKLNKPIVALKIGKSEKSRLATLTHTASLAGGSAASSALMKRLGIVEVNSIAVFLETLKLLHVCGPLSGDAICSLSCSGGEAGLIADMSEGSAIQFHGFSENGHRTLKQVLGPMVTVSNPLDYHTYIWHEEDKLFDCYRAVLGDRFDLTILIMDIPHKDRCDATAWQGPLRAIQRAKEATGANVALLATLPENLDEALGDDLLASGIVPLHGMDEMVPAVDAAIRAGKVSSTKPEPALLSTPAEADSFSSVGSRQNLNEARSKAELAEFGVLFPKSETAISPEQIAEATAHLTFPVVLKGLGVAHKSEAGAVTLNLNSPQDVEEAALAMPIAAGYLVEEMVAKTVAELLVGITRDETGIYLLTLGAGGVMTELLDDTASLIIPANRMEIAEALLSLKMAKVLTGYRGKPAANIEAILDAIEAAQAYCLSNPNLIELDINPLIAHEECAIAVDALIVKGETP